MQTKITNNSDNVTYSGGIFYVIEESNNLFMERK